MSEKKPRLNFWQIFNMNFGFFGVQYSFGLQQGNMSPIYKYLGAKEAELPYLWLAGPMTGLFVQPIVGAMSDSTLTRWGRRVPYFVVGAVFCSISLFLMPLSQALWMAVVLLWILDAANNITMEPYRAFISDKLDESQHSAGFLTQSAFTGLGQTLSYVTPTLLVLLGVSRDAVTSNNIPHVTVAAFIIGSFFSIFSILWTVKTTKENPLPADEVKRMRENPIGIAQTIRDIVVAFKEMPMTMKQLALVMFCQWYAMFCYWQYIVSSLSMTLFQTLDQTSPLFREANLINGQIGGFYNFVAFFAALILVKFTNKYGPKATHSFSLTLAGIGMLCIPLITHRGLLFLPMVGVGIAWASLMGNPYIMLAGSIPPERTGVYMGIFNMFIVIPMMIQIFTVPLMYNPLLASNPENVIRLAGGLMLAGAIATLFVKLGKQQSPPAQMPAGGH